MKDIKTRSVLVIFGDNLPQKNKTWWRQFSQVIGPINLREDIQRRGLFFVDISTKTDYGNVHQAYELVANLSKLKLADGSRLSKLINWQGYELWWMNYGHIEHNFCLPYTQYRRLLEYLKDFDETYLYQASSPDLFRYFLRAYHRQGIELKDFRSKLRKWLIPGGILVQLILSAVFLLPLIIIRPKVMYRIGDRIDPPFACDFRHRILYQELLERKVRFVEFIRSLQPWYAVLRNAWQRKRPVIYCTAITYFILGKLKYFERKEDKKLMDSIRSGGASPEENFWILCATHYLKGKIRATQWSIKTMQWILQLIGVRAAIIISASSRALPEVLGCQLVGIGTVGIQHGLAFYHLLPHDFMPEYDGKKSLSIDKYGLWSEWWKEYYLARSKAYQKEQLYVSGPMRPLEKKAQNLELSGFQKGPLKVLFISEQLVNPKEEMPYLLALLDTSDFALSLKLRPQSDEFEDWLKKNEPDILKRIAITKEDIHQAISQSDVVVGSRSTAVLEGLCQLKPFVSFWTDRWGDYFNIKSFDESSNFFAQNPLELVQYVRKSVEIPKEDLRKLQTRFFGDPYQNGAQWVVDQVENFIKKHGK